MSIEKLTAYVGTYTTGESKGIYSFILNLNSGKIDDIKLAAQIGNPTYLSITKDNKRLYSVAKMNDEGGAAGYSIDSSTGELRLINYETNKGAPPCYVSLDDRGSFLFSANYHKGTAEVYELNSKGLIDKTVKTILHEGSGPNKERQEKAHAHYAALTPDQNFLCVVDLGLDRIFLYRFNNENGQLEEHSRTELKPGCGPRHLVFHPLKNYAYVITELTSKVITLKYLADEGSLKVVEYTPALPEDFIGDNLGSAIHVSADGSYLYTSNRGHDSIAVFKIDPLTGIPRVIEHVNTGGIHPRDFAIDPTGNFLVASNQNSNSLVSFRINKETGCLSKVDEGVYLPNPVCIKFLNVCDE